MDLCEHINNSSGTLEKTDSGYRQEFTFPVSFPGFDGHFPGNPILPGVIQTLIGELSSSAVLKKQYPHENLRLENVTRCKFTRPVRPDEKLVLTFSLKTKALKHISLCSLSVGTETAATYQLIFSPEVV